MKIYIDPTTKELTYHVFYGNDIDGTIELGIIKAYSKDEAIKKAVDYNYNYTDELTRNIYYECAKAEEIVLTKDQLQRQLASKILTAANYIANNINHTPARFIFPK